MSVIQLWKNRLSTALVLLQDARSGENETHKMMWADRHTACVAMIFQTMESMEAHEASGEDEAIAMMIDSAYHEKKWS